MPQALLPGGIALEYETFGEPADPAILLIAGFGAQMISWDSGFCEGLARRGFVHARRQHGGRSVDDGDPRASKCERQECTHDTERRM